MHGGNQHKLPEGQRGGAKPTSFLYRRHLHASEREAFDAAAVDSIDDEIRLAKANLDAAVKAWAADPRGGVVQSRGDSVIRERLWFDIVREHVECVAKLLRTRIAMGLGSGGGEEDIDGYESWLAAQRAGGPPAEPPGSSSGAS
jgi:hypothetical protein